MSVDRGIGELKLDSAGLEAVFEAASPDVVTAAVQKLAADVASLTGLPAEDSVPVRIRTSAAESSTPGLGEDESYWLVVGVAAWIAAPWIVALVTTPKLASVLSSSSLNILGLAYLFYGSRAKFDPANAKEKLRPLYNLVVHKYYIVEFYLFLVRKVQQGIAVVSNWLEQVVVIGLLVNGIAGGAKDAGHRLRGMQTGRVHSYVTLILAGVTILVFWFVVWAE